MVCHHVGPQAQGRGCGGQKVPKAERCRAGQGRAGRCWVGPTLPRTWQHLRRGVGEKVEVGPEQDGTGTQLSCEDTLPPPRPRASPPDIHMTHVWLPAQPASLPITLTFLPPAPAGD